MDQVLFTFTLIPLHYIANASIRFPSYHYLKRFSCRRYSTPIQLLGKRVLFYNHFGFFNEYVVIICIVYRLAIYFSAQHLNPLLTICRQTQTKRASLIAKCPI